jgi:hypothetical protein
MFMQIVGVGFLRTGTTSLTLALERLGYGPCYHMRVLNAEPWRAADWAAAAQDPETADWDVIFAGYQSTVASPGAVFWREIIDAYPAAKVILTIRDQQDWYDSAASTIAWALAPPLPAAPTPSDHQGREHDYLEDVQRLAQEHEFGGQSADRDQAVAVFEQHIAAVRAYVPADRLLVFDIRDGWAPLCAFLGVAAPAEPFPWENDRDTFRQRQATGPPGWRAAGSS